MDKNVSSDKEPDEDSEEEYLDEALYKKLIEKNDTLEIVEKVKEKTKYKQNKKIQTNIIKQKYTDINERKFNPRLPPYNLKNK